MTQPRVGTPHCDFRVTQNKLDPKKSKCKKYNLSVSIHLFSFCSKDFCPTLKGYRL